MKSDSGLCGKDKIKIIYNVNTKMKKIKIFGDIFVINNKNICKMIINNKEYDLDSYFTFDNTNEIILTNINNITKINHMFAQCDSLLSIKDIENLNFSNITDMTSIFSSCKSLLSLPDISKLDTSKVTDMSFMFFECSSLYSLPDISNWNTSNVSNMSFMFSGCSSLLNLPDISKWETSNIINLSCIFYNCKSLISLPDISNGILLRLKICLVFLTIVYHYLFYLI